MSLISHLKPDSFECVVVRTTQKILQEIQWKITLYVSKWRLAFALKQINQWIDWGQSQNFNFCAESIILMANASSTINSISIAYNVLCKQVVTSIFRIYCAFNIYMLYIIPEKGFLFVEIIFGRWRSVHVCFMSENNVSTKRYFIIIWKIDFHVEFCT